MPVAAGLDSKLLESKSIKMPKIPVEGCQRSVVPDGKRGLMPSAAQSMPRALGIGGVQQDVDAREFHWPALSFAMTASS